MTDTIHVTTLAEAIAEVRRLLNEPTANFFSDDEITNWIKEGCVNLSTNSLCLEAQETITLVADTLSYAALDGPIDVTVIAKIYNILYHDGSNAYYGLSQIHPIQASHINDGDNTPGAPKYFFHFAGKIGVLPLTSAAIVTGGGELLVFCSKMTDDITLIPDHFQNLVIDFAMTRAKEKDRKYGEAQHYWAKYVNALNAQRADLYDRKKTSKDELQMPDRTVIVGD